MDHNAPIYRLADIAALAQLQFQQKHTHIDPVIGVNRQMRKQGFAVDLLTIDCMVSKQRITLLYEDAHPNTIKFQFATVDGDPGESFEQVEYSLFDQTMFYQLMEKGLL